MIELVMWKKEVCKKGKKVYMNLISMGNAKAVPPGHRHWCMTQKIYKEMTHSSST
jgi:hypothetical protein